MIVFKGITHILVSLSIYFWIFNIAKIDILNADLFVFGAILLSFASILPDIDHPSSLLGRYVAPIAVACKHRGLTHTVLGAVLFSIPVFIFINNKIYWLIFLVGYLLHLILDCLNPSGVNLYSPIHKHKYTFNLISTGSVEENIYLLLLILINADLLGFF